ncbi:hypothetical protein JGH11_02220 [Dysgonomonas sp. Marseille-P4677]|uniref:hypothetical protein n=1 Tax=Dysgonomonas sp. Marseille-P4677 TaxID=2364790 RepID=UPI001913501F|nr:hypothetical protein [Dysgonomonas sp. Marseille-P4677]MBK5719681.1 hypothetical protein [Dysgonomonas sp. Marseille-P4677]
MNIENTLNNMQHNKKSQYWIFFSVLVFLALFMMWCFGSSSSYSGYDFTFHYRRLYTLADALQHGIYPSFYVDFSNVDGYGYFTKGFYSDIILVPFALVAIFSNIYFAYDAMIFTMTVLCGVFMYHTIRVIYKSSYAASLSAILYTFAVYRLYDIYQRAALAEALSFTFLPIVFLGLYYVIKGDYRKWYVLAIGYSLLIYTHAIASVLMFVTLIILVFIYYKSFLKEPKRILYLVLAGVVTVVLTAYYTFPMLEQLSSNSFYLDSRSPGGGAGYGKVGFDYILWGFISGIAYPHRELWTGIGVILTLVVFLRFFVPKNKSQLLRSVDIGVIIGICFIIAISRIFPWGRFPFSLLGFIQYPWRLYEFVSFFFAVAGGYYVSLVFTKHNQRFVVSIVFIVATMATTYIQSENYKSLDLNGGVLTQARASLVEPNYENGYNLIGREYLPSKLIDISYIRDRKEKVDFRNEDTQIENLRREYNTTLFSVLVNKIDTLELPLLYYYGYSVTLNGEKLPVYQSDLGLVEVITDESGEIEAYYGGTTLQKTSLYISLIGLLILCVYIYIPQGARRINNGTI